MNTVIAMIIYLFISVKEFNLPVDSTIGAYISDIYKQVP